MNSCTYTRRSVLSALAAIGLLEGCQSVGISQPRTRYGRELRFGQGVARTYLVEDANGTPVSLGVEFTESALLALPQDKLSVRLELPPATRQMQYTFVTLDWNPHGHEPPKVYDTPHFDIHFYMIPAADVDRIAGGADPVVISPAFVPPEHISPGNQSVPSMGVHWVDRTAPEFHGHPFTNTFIYGASAGQLIFVEPMTTLSFLRSKADFSTEVKQPASVQRAGWYPTRYRIHYVPERQSYRVELSALRRREPGA